MEAGRPQEPTASLTAARVARYLLPLIALGLAVHLVLPQIPSLGHSFQVIKSMALWAVALAVVAQAASYCGSGYLLKALVRLGGDSLSVLTGAAMTLAGASFGMVAGGMVGSSAAIYRWMLKRNVRPEAAAVASTAPAVFNSITLVLVSLVGLVHLLAVRQLTRPEGIGFAVVLAALIGLVSLGAWGLRKRTALMAVADRAGRRWARFRHKEYKQEKTENRLKALFGAVDILVSGGWRGPLLGAVLNIVFDMLTLYFLFVAAGHRIGVGMLLIGYGVPLLLGRIAFVIPGGVGVIESSMVGLYTGLGVPDSVAVVVVLAYRILSFWLPVLSGFPLMLALRKSSVQGRHDELRS
jgi:uncharacterized protein (TIRG00374 family)